MNIDPRSGLSDQQVEQLREKLLQTRATVLGRHRRSDAATQDQPRGDAMDQAEVGYEQGLEADLSERDRQLLSAVDDALARMDEGRYGLSVLSGDPIGFDRLRVQPWAGHTQEEQELLEEQASGGEPRSQL